MVQFNQAKNNVFEFQVGYDVLQSTCSYCILSDTESLKKGTIKTSKDTPQTILLLGESGVGKSSVLEFLANALLGNDLDHYDFDILDHTNEHRGSDNRNQSRTNSVRLYQLTSKNGMVVSVEFGEYSECV